MKRILLVLGFLSGLWLSAELPSRDTQSISLADVPIILTFRSLMPGEAILAVMKSGANIERAALRVGDRSYALENGRPDGRRFALIGLDLNLKPAPLGIKIVVQKADGTAETFDKLVTVEARSFAQKRFFVNEALLYPPPQEQERVRREAVLVEAVYACLTPEWLGTGHFMAPLDAEPFPNFGQRRIYNRKIQSIHTGVDIPAAWGTPVRASNGGKIVLASSLYLSGKTVIIDHGRGVFTTYCHLSKIVAKRGELVRKGEIVGKVGNTGRSTGPHLHWAARILGCRVDPFSLVGLPIE
jgi:murein DD-endopeptidase MepM/ murein hydrolase activator NlpD